jgi:hypothetical protein
MSFRIPARGQYFVRIPHVTFAELSRSLQAKLHIQTLRVEGDPNLPISHVAFLPGSSGLEKQVCALCQPTVEVLIRLPHPR